MRSSRPIFFTNLTVEASRSIFFTNLTVEFDPLACFCAVPAFRFTSFPSASVGAEVHSHGCLVQMLKRLNC